MSSVWKNKYNKYRAPYECQLTLTEVDWHFYLLSERTLYNSNLTERTVNSETKCREAL